MGLTTASFGVFLINTVNPLGKGTPGDITVKVVLTEAGLRVDASGEDDDKENGCRELASVAASVLPVTGWEFGLDDFVAEVAEVI